MHKSAVRYEQSRTVRAATEATRNDHVDASAFRGGLEAERDRLVAEKRALETDITELKARITRAKALAWEKKNYTNPKTYQRWEFDRIEKSRRINVIESQLAELKRVGGEERRKTTWDAEGRLAFFEAFHMTAKEVLADAVYDRVRVAALHRFSQIDPVSAALPLK